MKRMKKRGRAAAVLAVFLAVILGAGKPAAVLATGNVSTETEEETEKQDTGQMDTSKNPEEGKDVPAETEEETTPAAEEETTSATDPDEEEETSEAPTEEESDTEEETTEKLEEETTTEEATTEEETTETSEAETATEETGTVQPPDENENRNPGAEKETQETLPENGNKVEVPTGSQVEIPTGNQAVNRPVPEYHDILNVVVPADYVVALNPDRLDVDMGDGTISNEQVLSRSYGIVNKSSVDVAVTLTLEVKDMNGGRIMFVDSADTAVNAGRDVYAVYLTAVPSDRRMARSSGIGVDADAAELSDVAMVMDEGRSVTLHEGTNQLEFNLSKAEYSLKEENNRTSSDIPENGMEYLELKSLAEDGTGTAAFTFGGAVNPDADWTKLPEGIRISMVYNYKAADSGEETSPSEGSPQQAEHIN